jgi:ABC-type glycerol-3-phosphate transport system permease component
VRRKRVTSVVLNAVALGVFVVMVFPVYWMISTALKPDDEIIALQPTWLPGRPTLGHFSDAIERPFFWADVKCSRSSQPSRSPSTDSAAASCSSCS